MNLKEYAKQRDLTLPKVRKLCHQLLNAVPEDLTDEDIKKLDEALGKASQFLLESGEKEKLVCSITTAQEAIPETTEKVIEIVGVKTLQKNLLLYLQLVKTALQAKKFEHDSLVFQAEQAFYGDLANYQKQTFEESLNRMNQAAAMTSWQGVKQHPTTPKGTVEDDSIQEEILELMETLGL